MASIEQLKVGQRVLYVAASHGWLEDAFPCLVVELPADKNGKVLVELASARAYGPWETSPGRLRIPARTCRTCGCIEEWACEGGCYWVEPDLCSACVQRGAELARKLSVG